MLKPQRMKSILDSPFVLDVFSANSPDNVICLNPIERIISIIKNYKEAGRDYEDPVKALDAIWNLELTRYKMKIKLPELYADMAKPMMEQRTALLHCYEWVCKHSKEDKGNHEKKKGKGLVTMVNHWASDQNIWRIVCSYI